MQLLQDEIVARREKVFQDLVGDKYRSIAGDTDFYDLSQKDQDDMIK